MTPVELVELAKNRGVGTLAITDHDTLEGVKDIYNNHFSILHSSICVSNIRLISGIEMTAKVDKGQMHILGYGIDINDKNLNDKMTELKNNSINSVLSVIEVLKKDYNIRFTYEEIKALVNANHNLGRPDIAKLMIKRGIVSSVQEAFDRYLIDAHNKIRSVSKGLKYDEILELITHAGGIPVLAHPKSLELKEKELLLLLKDMIKKGLQGLEVYHSSFTKEEMDYYKNIANKFDLLISGGSDFHGKGVKPGVELGTGKNNNLYIEELSLLKKLK